MERFSGRIRSNDIGKLACRFETKNAYGCDLGIQVDILAGELYLEFVLMELGSGESSGPFGTGVLHRISIPFIWAEWFGLGSHF